jgi:hypothetical protein
MSNCGLTEHITIQHQHVSVVDIRTGASIKETPQTMDDLRVAGNTLPCTMCSFNLITIRPLCGSVVKVRLTKSALIKILEANLLPLTPFSIKHKTGRSFGIGTMACKMCTLVKTLMGIECVIRYKIKNIKVHSILQTINRGRSNMQILRKNVRGFCNLNLIFLQASFKAVWVRDDTGSPLASVFACFNAGSPVASAIVGICFIFPLKKDKSIRILIESTWSMNGSTGSPSASVATMDYSGSLLGTATIRRQRWTYREEV